MTIPCNCGKINRLLFCIELFLARIHSLSKSHFPVKYHVCTQLTEEPGRSNFSHAVTIEKHWKPLPLRPWSVERVEVMVFVLLSNAAYHLPAENDNTSPQNAYICLPL